MKKKIWLEMNLRILFAIYTGKLHKSLPRKKINWEKLLLKNQQRLITIWLHSLQRWDTCNLLLALWKLRRKKKLLNVFHHYKSHLMKSQLNPPMRRHMKVLIRLLLAFSNASKSKSLQILPLEDTVDHQVKLKVRNHWHVSWELAVEEHWQQVQEKRQLFTLVKSQMQPHTNHSKCRVMSNMTQNLTGLSNVNLEQKPYSLVLFPCWWPFQPTQSD